MQLHDSLPDFPATPLHSCYIKEHLHWIPISNHIEYKVLLIVLKAQMGGAPKYLDAIRLPSSASSLRPLSSLETVERRGTFVPRTRTTIAMSRSFSVIGPSLWIAYHLVFLSYHPIFLRPYHFLKLVSFLGANRTKNSSVGPRLLRDRYIN